MSIRARRGRRIDDLDSNTFSGCCMICCSPCLLTIFALDKLLKCICCCPGYTAYIKDKIIPQEYDIVVPIAIAIPISEITQNRYYGKIWGIRNNMNYI